MSNTFHVQHLAAEGRGRGLWGQLGVDSQSQYIYPYRNLINTAARNRVTHGCWRTTVPPPIQPVRLLGRHGLATTGFEIDAAKHHFPGRTPAVRLSLGLINQIFTQHRGWNPLKNQNLVLKNNLKKSFHLMK